MKTVLAGKIEGGILTSCKCAPAANESSFPMSWWMNNGKIGPAVVNDLATVE